MSNPIELAIALNAVGLVSNEMRDKVQNDSGNVVCKAELIMADVEEILTANRSIEKYETFCRILIEQKSDLYVKRYGEVMKGDMERWKVDTGYYLDCRTINDSKEVSDNVEKEQDGAKNLIGNHSAFRHVLMGQRSNDLSGMQGERRNNLRKWKMDTDFHLDWLVIFIDSVSILYHIEY